MKAARPGAQLVAHRWAKGREADREQAREAGRLGGRLPSCHCGECVNCTRREKRRRKAEETGGRQL